MASSIRQFRCDDGILVRGDGVHDDTTGIRRAFAAAPGDLVIPTGKYRVTSTVRWDTTAARRVTAEAGAKFVFQPKDDSKACLDMVGAPPSYATKILDGLEFVGPEASDPTTNRAYKVGDHVGLRIRNVAYGTLANLQFSQFGGAGLHIEHGYYWNISHVNAHHNGYGVRCAAANASNFYALMCRYNLYGCENVQSLIGGCIEGNARSGTRYTDLGGRYSLHDVYFEANNLARDVPGEADIWCGDPAGAWMPRVLAISGATTFNSDYRGWKVATHHITGCVMLVITAAVKFFENPWVNFYLHPHSNVTEASAGNAMIEVPNGFRQEVYYGRPEFKMRESPPPKGAPPGAGERQEQGPKK
jgi:hypothetical protein